jgi:L-ascorbate 6-phosphate lactonase
MAAVRGAELIDEINRTHTATPTLWWLGHCGFAIRYASLTFYIDPCLAPKPNRIAPPPLGPQDISNADLILCTHEHASHMDPDTLLPALARSPLAKIVMPKATADYAHNQLGIPLDRMSTTDNGLRIEFFKDNLYGRIYSVPAAHPDLQWTPIGGYPRLGYLIRFERITIYHAGDTLLYPDLAARLKPYNPTVAILPIAGPNLSIHEGAQLAEEIGADWLIPMHYGSLAGSPPDAGKFVEHILGHRPSQKFKVFEEPGEKWTIPQLDS